MNKKFMAKFGGIYKPYIVEDKDYDTYHDETPQFEFVVLIRKLLFSMALVFL